MAPSLRLAQGVGHKAVFFSFGLFFKNNRNLCILNQICKMLRTSLWLFFTVFLTHAQIPDAGFMGADFHRDRRQKVINELPKNSIAVLFSSPIRNRSNDVNHPYHQDPNFYYLTGCKEPHAVLLLFEKPTLLDGVYVQEILFVRNRNSRYELWEGEQLGPERAERLLGFQKGLPTHQFESVLASTSDHSQILHLGFIDDIRDNPRDNLDLFSLVALFKKHLSKKKSMIVPENDTPVVDNKTLSSIMAQLREVKTPEELERLQKAIDISVVGQIEVMKAIHPAMSEREIQGLHEFVFRKYGAQHQGYPSIVGSGNNGAVLHYTHNTAEPVGDQLVLMDVGASYYGYTADITRTIPANGIFTEEQSAIYNLVLSAQEAGIQAAVPGAPFSAPGKSAKEIIEKGLLALGIIEDTSQARRYFPHGTSHYIGLDVHDQGTYGPLQPNSIITVEPGVYIPENSPCDSKWWGIAIRIEDDILITNEGPVNLSKGAPKTIADIEATMQISSALEDFILPKLP